ncbi:MAG: hypothetical protein VXY90_03655 [Pseudomonadota bacterium]|nr:hypothetical protein [Pseudomonadota bacterium]
MGHVDPQGAANVEPAAARPALAPAVPLAAAFKAVQAAGAAALADVLALSQITELSLPANHSGDAGAAAIARKLPASRVASLSLGGNRDIGDVGARHLARALEG